MLWKLRDDLQKNCSVSCLRELLNENEMSSTGGESDVNFFLCSHDLHLMILFNYHLLSMNSVWPIVVVKHPISNWRHVGSWVLLNSLQKLYC